MFAWFRRKWRRLKRRFVPKPKTLELTDPEVAEFIKVMFGNYQAQHQRTRRAIMSRRDAKRGRNAPCPCGSVKKYKKCCGSIK